MPETAVREPETDEENEIPTEIPTTSSTPLLDQYMGEMRAVTPGAVFQEPEDSTESGTEENVEQPEGEEAEQEAPAAPAELDIEALLKDRTIAPKIQSYIDKAADAAEKAKSDAYRKRIAQEEAAKAKEEADRRYAEIVRLANSAEETDEVFNAREELAHLNHVKLLEQEWEKNRLPEIIDEHFEKEIRTRIEQLSSQYSEGYQRIPELQDPLVLQKVHHLAYQNAADWLEGLVNTVSEQRIQSRVQEAVADREKELEAEVQARVSEELAKRRSGMPATDTSTRATPGGSEVHWSKRYRRQSEAEAAFVNNEITADQFRYYRSLDLPY